MGIVIAMAVASLSGVDGAPSAPRSSSQNTPGLETHVVEMRPGWECRDLSSDIDRLRLRVWMGRLFLQAQRMRQISAAERAELAEGRFTGSVVVERSLCPLRVDANAPVPNCPSAPEPKIIASRTTPEFEALALAATALTGALKVSPDCDKTYLKVHFAFGPLTLGTDELARQVDNAIHGSDEGTAAIATEYLAQTGCAELVRSALSRAAADRRESVRRVARRALSNFEEECDRPSP